MASNRDEVLALKLQSIHPMMRTKFYDVDNSFEFSFVFIVNASALILKSKNSITVTKTFTTTLKFHT